MCSYRETNSAFEASIICSGCGRSQGLAQDLDISMSTVEAATRDYRRLMDLGNRDHDITGLISLKHGQG